MLIQNSLDLRSSEITPESLYLNRRQFIQKASAALGLIAMQTKGKYDTAEKPTRWEDITMFNNYYEFGTNKDEPARNSKNFKPKPWTVKVSGLVKKPATYNFDDLVKGISVEDRIYRMRCVEGWSMVIPWQGIPLGDLIKKLDPLPSAKFIEFRTLLDPNQYPEQRRSFFKAIDWPYIEGLRLDEAMNPLAFIATDIYGKPLPNQNGAPLRLVTPWKYGFKGIKAIVDIRFVEKKPVNSWQQQAPGEYGFYANVNPDVRHPRWEQNREQRIGEFFRRKTLMFNGYADQVGSMYSGMDLRKDF
jgi:sulfoxide reductase catalytic subunit YedY